MTSVGASSDGSGQHAAAPHHVTTPRRQNSGISQAVPNATVTIKTYTTTNPISAATIEVIRPIRSIVRQARHDPASAPIQITDPARIDPTLLRLGPNSCRTYGVSTLCPIPFSGISPIIKIANTTAMRRAPANNLPYGSSQPRTRARIPATATGRVGVVAKRE